MKFIKYISTVFVGSLILIGCDSLINTEPVNMISEVQVYQDPALADAHLNDIYDNMEFIDGYSNFSYYQVVDDAAGGELRPYGAFQAPYEFATSVIDEEGPGHEDYWKYYNIRLANEFIEKLRKSDLESEYIQKREAEARFLRAFMYLEMVKRFGGVPIVTKAQDIDANEDELFMERDSEQAVYDFIAAEMDTISNGLPEDGYYGTENVGRATKWAALALKSRAMVYAASLGEFGDMKLDGLLGIPDGDVQTYWQEAYDASKEIIDSSPHILYNEISDKVENYHELFIDESEANKEVIFGEVFDGESNKGHSFNYMARPAGFAEAWGSNFNIIYDMVELFEFEDGSSGKIDRSDLTGQEWSSEELFGNRDPRFRASVFYPETPYQGETVYFHSSTIVDGEQVTDGTLGDGWPAKAPNRNTTRTGLQMRKRLDENDDDLTSHEMDDTDHIEFRVGEIYLNFAEAAFYLGRTGEALDAINELRDRVGMPDESQITQEILRNERQVELAFEGHRYWDLRRWRIAEEVLDGVRLQGLRYDYNWDTKKYQISLKNAEGTARIFQERYYYLPLGIDRLADNPEFVENPGY